MDLSNERAQSIAAYLRSKPEDIDLWMSFYEGNVQSKKWGTREDQHMLHALPFGKDPYYAREATGRGSGEFTNAVKAFQSAKGLAADGVMGSDTRRALITEYMAAEGTTFPDGTTLDTLGCGQNHQLENKTVSLTNRRVDVFAFVSQPIVPSLDEERNHQPGCTVYTRWRRAATETIQ
jgi:hypothetical protein